MIQKVKEEAWIDETGKKVPTKYITPIMRKREFNIGRIYKGANALNKKLVAFKNEVTALVDEVYKLHMEQLSAGKKEPGKGNYTMFNFDRSLKVEVSINERIDFDELTLIVAKEKFDLFLSQDLDSKSGFGKEIVTDAFSTKSGKIDSKKVMDLIRWRSKINIPIFQEACDLVVDAIRHPDSKTYYRVWERSTGGEYKLIDLNFSSI